MKKFFMAFLAVATIAMIGCKKDEPTPTPTPGPDPDPSIEIPDIAAPGAGKTTIAIYATVCPRGCYLLGTATTWDPADASALFTPVSGHEHWYSYTIDYAPDFGGKVCALPSDESVTPCWDFQWGKNHDPNDPNSPEEGVANTVILKGDGDFEYENSGQPKLIGISDNSVVYIQVKNWAKSPIIEAVPLETAWLKTDWVGDNTGWEWREMTKKSAGVFEYTGVWQGKGVNINAEGKDDGAGWYDTPNIEKYEGAKAGDEVKFIFTSEKGTIGTLKMELVSAAADVPAGNHKFTITISNRTYADGDECIFTGNFEEKSWADSDRAMTYDSETQTWSWTGDYPKNFEYKVIYNTKWATGDNVKLQAEGETFAHTFEIGE